MAEVGGGSNHGVSAPAQAARQGHPGRPPVKRVSVATGLGLGGHRGTVRAFGSSDGPEVASDAQSRVRSFCYLSPLRKIDFPINALQLSKSRPGLVRALLWLREAAVMMNFRRADRLSRMREIITELRLSKLLRRSSVTSLVGLLVFPVALSAQKSLYIPDYLISIRGENSFSVSTKRIRFSYCKDWRRDIEYPVIGWNATDDAVYLTYLKKKARRKLTLSVKRSKYRGIDVVEFTMPQFPDLPKYGAVSFRRPVAETIALNFDEWSYCASLGYEPGILKILYLPGRQSDLEAWVQQMVARGLLEPTVADEDAPIGIFDNIINAVAVEMVSGQELKVMNSLKSKSWLIDYTMNPFPLGPGAELVSLPTKTIDYLGNASQSALLVTERVLGLAFPRLADGEFSITNVKGTSFDVLISAPMTKIWPADGSYKGYWLHTKLRIFYYANGRDSSKFISYAYLDAREGWLPKWPHTDRPPQTHYIQFPLSDEGRNKYSNYDVLRYIQARITQAFVRHFNAAIIDG
jgi:hypothetical protein